MEVIGTERRKKNAKTTYYHFIDNLARQRRFPRSKVAWHGVKSVTCRFAELLALYPTANKTQYAFVFQYLYYCARCRLPLDYSVVCQ
jgi:hypothetical protein